MKKFVGQYLFFVTAGVLLSFPLLSLGNNVSKFLEEIKPLPKVEQFEKIRERLETQDNSEKDHEKLLNAISVIIGSMSGDEVRSIPKFGPNPPNMTVAEAAIDQWEFRSYVSVGAQKSFSLSNPTNNVTFWADIGQTRHGIKLIKFDDKTKRLRIGHGDQFRDLKLNGKRSQDKGDFYELQREEDLKEERRILRLAYQEEWERGLSLDPSLADLRDEWRAASEAWKENLKISGDFISHLPPEQQRAAADKYLQARKDAESRRRESEYVFWKRIDELKLFRMSRIELTPFFYGE